MKLPLHSVSLLLPLAKTRPVNGFCVLKLSINLSSMQNTSGVPTIPLSMALPSELSSARESRRIRACQFIFASEKDERNEIRRGTIEGSGVIGRDDQGGPVDTGVKGGRNNQVIFCSSFRLFYSSVLFLSFLSLLSFEHPILPLYHFPSFFILTNLVGCEVN